MLRVVPSQPQPAWFVRNDADKHYKRSTFRSNCNTFHSDCPFELRHRNPKTASPCALSPCRASFGPISLKQKRPPPLPKVAVSLFRCSMPLIASRRSSPAALPSHQCRRGWHPLPTILKKKHHPLPRWCLFSITPFLSFLLNPAQPFRPPLSTA